MHAISLERQVHCISILDSAFPMLSLKQRGMFLSLSVILKSNILITFTDGNLCNH